MDKLNLTQEIQSLLFDFYSIGDVEKVRDLISARKDISNKHAFALLNAKTGKTAEAVKQNLNLNNQAINEVVHSAEEEWIS